MNDITTVVIFIPMIRLSKLDDVSAILVIAEAIGFQLSELEVVNKLLNSHFAGGNGRDSLQIAMLNGSGSLITKTTVRRLEWLTVNPNG